METHLNTFGKNKNMEEKFCALVWTFWLLKQSTGGIQSKFLGSEYQGWKTGSIHSPTLIFLFWEANIFDRIQQKGHALLDTCVLWGKIGWKR